MTEIINPNLPLIDLHRHLDGSIRLQTIIELGKEHSLPIPAGDVESLRPYVQILTPAAGVMAFISKFKWMLEILVDYRAVERIAFENVEDAHREGLDYVELRFSPWFMAERHKLKPEKVVEAVCKGVDAGRKMYPIGVNLIGIISRTYGVEVGWLELEALLTQREHIVALDLAGDEANYPAGLFRDHFKKAREAGWKITVHAGESDGPDSIWQAVELLGAERIGHAVSALKDPKLIYYLRDNRIGIETNLTSNIQTRTVSSYPEHPIREFLEMGLLATINTDDPGISGIDLRHEFEVAYREVGLSLEQLHQAQRNAVEVAFLSEEEKQNLLSNRIM